MFFIDLICFKVQSFEKYFYYSLLLPMKSEKFKTFIFLIVLIDTNRL